MKNEIRILGIRFKNRSKEDACKDVSNAMSTGRRLRIFTPNPDILLKAQKNASLLEALNSAEILLPDGIGVIIASRLLNTPLCEKITGIDTAEFILSEAARMGLRVFLLGGKDGIALRASKNLSTKYPNLNICGTHHGFFDKVGEENKSVINSIQSSGPDILFVCLGSPAQEIWITDVCERLPSVKIFAGLGGALDVWSGEKKRAPASVQRCGMEWLWRALADPQKLKRVTDIPIFIQKILSQRLSYNHQKKQKRKYHYNL